MSEKFQINADLRKQSGTTVMRRMRRLEGYIPAIVYGGGKDSEAITISHKDISLALENPAIFSSILNLQLAGKRVQVVLKSVQRHPYKPQVLHVDFQRVRATDKLTVAVPIHLLNETESKGVLAGGIISRLVTEIEIQCLPADLPEALTLDVINLDVGESLHLADMQLPSGVHWLGGDELDEKSNQLVVSIHLPKAEVIEEGAAQAEVAEVPTQGEQQPEAQAESESESAES